MDKILKITNFYHPCKEAYQYEKLLLRNGRMTVLSGILKEICELLKSGQTYGSILEMTRERLNTSYEEEWFPLPWQRQQSLTDDLYLFQRLFQWLGNVKVKDANVPVMAACQKHKLLSSTSLIVEKNGVMYAVNIFLAKNTKSLNGKSMHTSSQMDLYALASKLFFEESYPGIRIFNVYLFSEKDTPGKMIPTLLQTSKKDSNILILDDTPYYEDGLFCKEVLQETIEQVLEIPVPKSCFGCLYTSYCNQATQDIRAVPAKEVAPKTYQLPQFTPLQQQVIEHVDGPMLVCAGPGSGKTATLVGRLKYLMEQKGIPSEYLLAVTFTKEAAEVLQERCRTFCAPDDVPKISTLNALGYEILRQREDIIGPVQVLDQREQMRILEHLVGDIPPLTGFNSNVLYGKMGYLATLARKLEKYFSMTDEQFYLEEPELDSDFGAFALRYKRIINKRGFITFDEQISLCINLFKQHPDVLTTLQKRYQYIAVDEYQDINSVQNEFITMLAGKRANLVVVGDDDQSIYGFRGGSHRFMLQFTKLYPSARTVILSENFRSTQALVKSASSIIQRNKERIQKDIHSTREAGTAPVYIKGITKQAIEDAVAECLKNGYSYEDIAILASKNATLKEMRAMVSFPSVLGKNYLIEEPLFLMLHDMLSFSYEANETALLHLGSTLKTSLSKELLEGTPSATDDILVQALADINCAINQMPPASFIMQMSRVTGWNGTASEEVLLNLSKEYRCTDTYQLFELLRYMILYSDETKVEKDISGCVQFITSHESKGLEFPVVFLLDDFKSEETEEKNRLFYVSLTRAKEKFYLFQNEKSGLKGGVA